jgi:hypothetical protein
MNYPAASSGVSKQSNFYFLNNAASGGVLDPKLRNKTEHLEIATAASSNFSCSYPFSANAR